MRLRLLLSFSMLLAGCAAPPLYNWGGYEQGLFAGYKDTTKMEELRVKLETHIASMETSKLKVAPGLYAELGTLYLQSGMKAKAIDFYARERKAWPESTQMMTSLITNLEREPSQSAEKK